MSYEDIVAEMFRKSKYGSLTLVELIEAVKKNGYWSRFEEEAGMAPQILIQDVLYGMKRAGEVDRDLGRAYYLANPTTSWERNDGPMPELSTHLPR